MTWYPTKQVNRHIRHASNILHRRVLSLLKYAQNHKTALGPQSSSQSTQCQSQVAAETTWTLLMLFFRTINSSLGDSHWNTAFALSVSSWQMPNVIQTWKNCFTTTSRGCVDLAYYVFQYFQDYKGWRCCWLNPRPHPCKTCTSSLLYIPRNKTQHRGK